MTAHPISSLMTALLVLAAAMTMGSLVTNLGSARSSRRRTDELRRDVDARRSRRTSMFARRFRPHSRVRPAVVLVLAVFLAVVLGPIAAVVGIAVWVAARRTNAVVVQRRTRAHVEASAPDAIELFVLLIHAGLTPVQAVRDLSSSAPGATRAGFAAVVHRLERGEPFADALAALPARLGPCMIGLADTVASADRYGSALAPMLETLALEARAARRRRNEADARRLPIRLSFPLVACTLPSFVLLAIAPAVLAALSSISVPI